MESIQDTASEAAGKVLGSKGFFPIVVLLQAMLWVSVGRSETLGQAITAEMVMLYMILPVLFGFWWQIPAEDIEAIRPLRRDANRSLANGRPQIGGLFERLLAGKQKSSESIEAYAKRVDEMRRSVVVHLLYFSVFFGIFWAFTFGLHYIGTIPVGTVILPNALGVFTYQLVCVVVAETIIFIAIIPLKLRRFFATVPLFRGRLGIVAVYAISQGLFAVFHWWAVEGNLFSLGFTFAMGCFFLMLADNYGLSSVMGAHFGFNMVVSGLLSGGVITGQLLTIAVPGAILLVLLLAGVLILAGKVAERLRNSYNSRIKFRRVHANGN